MLVTTSIYGGYDRLKPHPPHDKVDGWVCFTDDPTLSCPGWDVVLEPPRHPHPRMAAKWRKTHPPDDDTSIWLDGSIEFNAGLIDALLAGLDLADTVMWLHPDRTSIVAEADVSWHMEKYHHLPVREQAAHYVREWGWPDNRLYAAGVSARRHTPAVLQAGAAWYAECERWTYQDQISLPPVLARYGVTVEPLAHSLWGNPWMRIHRHASDL